MDPSERKALEKAQRADRIVDVAQQVFFENGYGGSTMDQIATAAGYKKRTLYLYFKDKEALFLAVVLRGLRILNSMLQQAYAGAGAGPGRSRLGALGRALFDFSLSNPEYAELIMIFEAKTCVYYPDTAENSLAVPDPESGDLRAACQAVTDADADMVTRAIADGIADGTIRSDMTPRQLMLIVWGQILGILQVLQMRKKYFHDAYGISHETLFNRFMEMAEKGLAP
ncbi:MAG: TetR/AcrR family transcriptional regulator [Desulfobacterales bacterium]|nr:TetR/AcrR family transcriptional regulator [Desulfobacterales bacterium]